MPPSPLLDRARQLRQNRGECEGRLWGELRARRLGGWKWKRQVPRGPFIVDFLCAELGLVLELDGPQHLDTVEYDERRTRYLEGRGLRVIRYPSHEVFESLEGLCMDILLQCGGKRPQPLS